MLKSVYIFETIFGLKSRFSLKCCRLRPVGKQSKCFETFTMGERLGLQIDHGESMAMCDPRNLHYLQFSLFTLVTISS